MSDHAIRTLSAEAGWDERVKGLNPQLKDKLALRDELTSLDSLLTSAIQVDHRLGNLDRNTDPVAGSSPPQPPIQWTKHRLHCLLQSLHLPSPALLTPQNLSSLAGFTLSQERGSIGSGRAGVFIDHMICGFFHSSKSFCPLMSIQKLTTLSRKEKSQRHLRNCRYMLFLNLQITILWLPRWMDISNSGSSMVHNALFLTRHFFCSPVWI